MLSILVVQEYDNFTVLLLKMVCSGCCLGKCNYKSLKKSFPMFVATFLLYGGLYHTTLLRFLVRRDVVCRLLLYVSSSEYPASPRAC